MSVPPAATEPGATGPAEEGKIDRREAEPQQIPARMLNEFVYCQRLFYYEFVEGVFVENADTLRGGALHQRVDSGTGALPKAKRNSYSLGRPIPSRSFSLLLKAVAVKGFCKNSVSAWHIPSWPKVSIV